MHWTVTVKEFIFVRVIIELGCFNCFAVSDFPILIFFFFFFFFFYINLHMKRIKLLVLLTTTYGQKCEN